MPMQGAGGAAPGSISSSRAPAGKPSRPRYYLASEGGVLPGACAGGLWDAAQKERTSSWNKAKTCWDVPQEIPQPQRHSPSPDTKIASRSSIMKRGDMEIPCQWDRALVREMSAEGQRGRAVSIDYHALAGAQQRSSSDASSTAQEHRGRTSSRRQAAPCSSNANRFNLFSSGENPSPRSSSETPPKRTAQRRPSDPWAGREVPISGGISDRQRSTSSRTTTSTALYNSPLRTTRRSLPREGGVMEALLWGSSALPLESPVPAVFGETITPRSYIQPRVGMHAHGAELPPKKDSTESHDFMTDPLIGSAANHQKVSRNPITHAEEPPASTGLAQQEQPESAKTVSEIRSRNPITLAEEPPASPGTSKPYNGLAESAPFGESRQQQQSPRDVVIPGMSVKLNGAINHHTKDPAIEAHMFLAGVLSDRQPYHPSTRPALYRQDRDEPLGLRKSIDSWRAESMEPPPSPSRSSVKRPKATQARTGVIITSSVKASATERSPATTTRSARVPASPATTSRSTYTSAKAPATERSPAVPTHATRDPTIGAEAHATERSPATTSRATKDPATAIGAEECAAERSPSPTSRAARGARITAEPGASPGTTTRSARGPTTPRTRWRW